MSNANAEVILVRPDDAVILQQRDTKPGISNSGMVTTFGGHIEVGETPAQAAVRELDEETALLVDPEDLEYFGLYHKTQAEHGEDWDVHYFILRNVNEFDIQVNEGQGYLVVRPTDDLTATNLSKLCRQVLSDFFKYHHSDLIPY